MNRARNILRRVLRRPGALTAAPYEAYPTFAFTGEVFLKTLRAHGKLSSLPSVGGPAAAVVVSPWVSTPVPWYAVMLALGLARRGRRVALIWDDMNFPAPDVAAQNDVIGRVMRYVERYMPVLRLSDQPAGGLTSDERADVERLAALVVNWTLRGAPASEADTPWVRSVEDALAQALPRVRSALASDDFAYALAPGGVYAKSGLFLRAGRERGLRVATFDADQSVAQVCVDGIAAQNADLPRAFREIWALGEHARRYCVAEAQAELERRVSASDRYGYQAVAADGPSDTDGGALIALNVEWDTAALGKHELFDGTLEWLYTTIEEVLACGQPVTVRQHPSERRARQRSALDVRSSLDRRFGSDRRYRFVSADHPVNTYDLVASASVVLPFTSNIGIEAAAMGKPVLVSGAAYYADLGFVASATSREEYLDLLRAALAGALRPSAEMRERAWTCYYLNAVSNRVWTSFTPQPDDFASWASTPADEVLNVPVVQDMLEAIDTATPLALIRYRRATSEASR